MRLVDTHTHVWGYDTTELPWYSADLPPEWSGPYTHTDLIADMDAANVDEALLLPTSIYGRGERANEYTMRAIEAHPDRLWGVAVADYFADDARQRVGRVLAPERMLGVRMHACFEYGPTPGAMNRETEWIADPALDPVYEELAEREAALFVLPKPQQLSTVASVADAHPDVPVVVEHMAWPDEDADPDAAPWTDFERLAEHDNAYVKVSSIPRTSGEEWPYGNVAGYVQKLLEWFGPERLMLGSDYPWLDSMATMEECLTWVEETDYLSARDLSYLSYRTFENLRG